MVTPLNRPSSIEDFIALESLPCVVRLGDHLGGYDQNFCNHILNHINSQAQAQNRIITVRYHQILDNTVLDHYQNLKSDYAWEDHQTIQMFSNYRMHPSIEFTNFLCSFNGNFNVSRTFLVAALNKFGWFDRNYCSKNFTFSNRDLDGFIKQQAGNQDQFYRKFFTDSDSSFFSTINSFGHEGYMHDINIYNLERKITQSFLNLASESVGTSYYPFVSEKAFYSIVTRGLFLIYGQPKWHDHFEKYYGFKKYDKIFDYYFDSLVNPIERLIEMLCMISKFSKLSVQDWQDLYQLEHDTIEYNYDHYFSGNYARQLQKYDSKFQH